MVIIRAKIESTITQRVKRKKRYTYYSYLQTRTSKVNNNNTTEGVWQLGQAVGSVGVRRTDEAEDDQGCKDIIP